MGWRTVAGVFDAGTAVCAAFNAAYFIDRLFYGADLTASRRIAIGVLAIVSIGALLEAIALVTLASRSGDPMLPASVSWTAVRSLPFAGAAAVSGLIARRLVSR